MGGIRRGDQQVALGLRIGLNFIEPPGTPGTPRIKNMKELAQTLNQNGIDITSLKPLPTTGEETFYYLAVLAKDSFDLWQKIRGLVEQTGFWPLLIGELRDWQVSGPIKPNYTPSLGENLHNLLFRKKPKTPTVESVPELRLSIGTDTTYSVAKTIEIGLALDPLDLFSQKSKGFFNNQVETELKSLIEKWPEGIKPNSFIDIQFESDIFVILAPTRKSWEVPAFLRFGGWNECPSPEEQVCILKYWNNKYGAEVLAITYDTLECLISHPPQTREQALELSKEQYIYSGIETIENLSDIVSQAAGIVNNTTWYFWWD